MSGLYGFESAQAVVACDGRAVHAPRLFGWHSRYGMEQARQLSQMTMSAGFQRWK